MTISTFNRLISVVLALLLVAQSLSATTYFIDFDAGSDSNNGTSQGTPWRTLPGTRAANSGSAKQAAWGSITTANKLVPGDIFKLKQGTTYSSADSAGIIYIDNDYYTDAQGNGFDAYIFEPDTTWGTGVVTINSAGLKDTANSAIGGMLIRVNGVTLRAATTNSFILGGATNSMIYVKEKNPNSDPVYNFTALRLNVTNYASGLLTDFAGAGTAGILFRRGADIRILSNVVNNAYAGFGNGIAVGETDYTISNAVIRYNLVTYQKGDVSTDDSGIGVKAFNLKDSIIADNVSTNNLKGFDIGHQDNPGALSAYIGSAQIYNNVASSNLWGINLTWSGDTSYTGYVVYKMWNNLIANNYLRGSKIYASPLTAYLVHNTYYNNGAYQGSAFGAEGDLEVGHNNETEDRGGSYGLNVFKYNNIFYRPGCVFSAGRYYGQNFYNLTDIGDYNIYLQSTTQTYFADWGYYATTGVSGEVANISFGAPWTPGSLTGQWYTYYTKFNTAPPAGGLGHFHSDVNSIVLPTGHARNTGGYITDAATGKPAAYDNGMNISVQPWYTAAMGVDRENKSRVWWSMGANEDPAAAPAPPAGVPYILTTKKHGF